MNRGGEISLEGGEPLRRLSHALLGDTHAAAFGVVSSVWQDEGLDPEGTFAVTGTKRGILTTGQDHEKMRRRRGLVSGERWKSCHYCY